MKFKNIASLLVASLFSTNFCASSFAGTLSQDGRYETFEGSNIAINDILEEDKVNIKVEGNTMVNIHPKYTPYLKTAWDVMDGYTIESRENYIKVSGDNPSLDWLYINGGSLNLSMFKPNTTYTVVCSKLKGVDYISLQSGNATNQITNHIDTVDGKLVYVFNTYANIPKENQILYFGSRNTNIDVEIENPMIFEGDVRDSLPTGYIEGMKSSFEDGLVTQDMVDNGLEKAENLGKYKAEVKSTGKNLLNDWMIGYIEDEDYPNPGSHTTFGCDENGHHLNSGVYRMCTDYVNIKPNTYYTLSKYRGGRTTFYDSNYNYISNIINENYSGYIYTPSNACYIRVHVDWWTGDMDTLKIQLEEGSVATEYEPYKESTNTFYLNSPLLEGDTIEYINGQATHVKRSAKLILNGSEDWAINYDQSNNKTFFLAFKLRDEYFSSQEFGFVDKMPSIAIWGAEKEYEGLKVNHLGKEVYIRIDKSRLKTVDLNGFKQWLYENPITFVYELAEPICEPIKSDLSIELFGGATHVSNNTLVPANMTLTVDRVLNRATEAIEQARISPTIDNISIARMWTNMIKDSSKKDSLQDDIDSFTEIQDLSIDKKQVSSNADIYIKMKNSLSLSLDTNSIMFDDVDGTEIAELKSAVNLTVSSSLPYKINASLESDIYNSDKSSKLDKSTLNIKPSKESVYKGFADISTPIVLLDDQSAGVDTIHSIDMKLDSIDIKKADIYKTSVKFEIEQK